MTPADVIREQRMLLGRNRELQVLEGWTRHPMFPRPANPVIRDGVHQEFVTTFPGAVPFLWSPAMLGVATSYNLPPHIVAPPSELLPFPAMWWRFEDGDTFDYGGWPGIGWLVISADPGIVEVFAVGDLDAPRLPDTTYGRPTVSYAWARLETGRQWPSGDMTTTAERPMVDRLLQMLSFLASRWVDLRRVAPRPDHQTRRLARAGVSLPEPDVIVVQLRAPVPPSHQEREPGTERDWHFRWMVRGHHRAQWYPSLNAHKVVWIAPHLKGPAEAPLKPQLYAVVR